MKFHGGASNLLEQIFVDTDFLVALLSKKDQLHKTAFDLASNPEYISRITTQMVLTEFLTTFGSQGMFFREKAVQYVDSIIEHPNYEVIPQTSSLFNKALNKYKNRLDKDWSLTDCASFVVMESQGITKALTHDHHFSQAGFSALMREDSTK